MGSSTVCRIVLHTTILYKLFYHDKMAQLTEKHEFKISSKQKQTLKVLRNKYRINTSQFIRDAIDEKLTRERDDIFRNYKEIQLYLRELENCPF